MREEMSRLVEQEYRIGRHHVRFLKVLSRSPLQHETPGKHPSCVSTLVAGTCAQIGGGGPLNFFMLQLTNVTRATCCLFPENHLCSWLVPFYTKCTPEAAGPCSRLPEVDRRAHWGR